MSVKYDETDRALFRAARAERPRTNLRAKALAAAAVTSTTAIVASTLGGKATAGATKVGIGGLLSWASLGARVVTLKGLLACATVVVVASVATREARLFEAPSPSVLVPRPVAPMAEIKVSAKASRVARPEDPLAATPVGPSKSEPTSSAETSRVSLPPGHKDPKNERLAKAPKTVLAAERSASSAEPHASNAEAPPRSKTAPPPPGSSQALGDELRLVDSARLALAQGDAKGALGAIHEHTARFPSGAFAIERESLRVSALVTLGRRDEAKAAAAAFLASYPKSAAAPRMATLLGE